MPTTGVVARDIVIAHQGWDELLLYGAPVVLAIVAVRWAERRAVRRRGEDAPDTGYDDGPPADDGTSSTFDAEPPAPRPDPPAP